MSTPLLPLLRPRRRRRRSLRVHAPASEISVVMGGLEVGARVARAGGGGGGGAEAGGGEEGVG